MSRLYGDWDRCGVKLSSLVNFGKFSEEKLKHDAELLLGIIKGHIINQDLPWVPLSESTAKIKKSEVIYIETGELLKKLAVNKKGKTYFVGAEEGIPHKESGLTLAELMFYLEYGTNRIPPRPLIQPSYEEFQKMFLKNWMSYLREFFRR